MRAAPRLSVPPSELASCGAESFTTSLEDLEGSFEELVLRSLVVRDHERTVRRDVVRLADHAIFPDHRGDPLPDRRALPAVVLQEEFDSRVAVPRQQEIGMAHD